MAGPHRALTLPWDETFDIGSKTGTPIDDQDYKIPFAFTGNIDKLTISVEPPRLTPDDEKKLSDAYRAAQDGPGPTTAGQGP